MNEPEISVIVPVYNLEKYIEETVGLLLGQTYGNLEIILVDDGSSDSSPEICDRLAAENENVIALHRKNGGVSAARNAGIAAAHGEYIGFCDGDDSPDGDLYAFLYETAKQSGADIAICGLRIVNPNGSVRTVADGRRREWNDSEDFLREFLRGDITMNVYTKLFRARICREIKFPEGFRTNEDKYYCFSAALRAGSIAINNCAKYTYYRRKGSSTVTEFTEKYFDGLKISDKIIEDASKAAPSLADDARAGKLAAALRTYKLMYMRNALGRFKSEAEAIVRYAKEFDRKTAKKYLARKNYLRYMLLTHCRPAFRFMTAHFDYN